MTRAVLIAGAPFAPLAALWAFLCWRVAVERGKTNRTPTEMMLLALAASVAETERTIARALAPTVVAATAAMAEFIERERENYEKLVAAVREAYRVRDPEREKLLEVALTYGALDPAEAYPLTRPDEERSQK